MEAILHVAPRAYVGVGKRPDHLPQPSSSAPLRIALEQAGDLDQVEQPEKLSLANRLLDASRIHRGEVEQRPSDGRNGNPLNHHDLVGLDRGAADSDVVVLSGAWSCGD